MIPESMEGVTLTVGCGLSLWRCKSCGHYMSIDAASAAIAQPRCYQCHSGMVLQIRTPQDIQDINDWLDTQLLFEHWRGPMDPITPITPRSA